MPETTPVADPHSARTCPECAEPVSNEDTTCPHCETPLAAPADPGDDVVAAGATQPAGRALRTRIIAALVLLLLLAGLVALAIVALGYRSDNEDLERAVAKAERARTDAIDERDDAVADRDTLKDQLEQVVGDGAGVPEAADDSEETNGAAVTETRRGKFGLDDGVAFKLTATRTTEVVAAGEYSDPVRAEAGGKLFVATVAVKNLGKVDADPFCGQTGAVAIDEDGRNFELESDGLFLPGNKTCQGIAPGFTNDETLVFQIPTDAKVVSVAFWNSKAENDSDGSLSYVRSTVD